MKKKLENAKHHVMRHLPEYTVGAMTIGLVVAICKTDAAMWVAEPEILYEKITPLGTVQVIAPE